MQINSNINNSYALFKPTLRNSLGILFLTFFVMMIVVSFMQLAVSKIITDPRNSFIISSALQAVLMFIFPSFLTAYLCNPSPLQYLGLKNKVYPAEFIGVIIVFVIATPALNVIIDWNANISFPENAYWLEKNFREWEDNAAAITQMVLGDTSIWGLISGILFVGCLTGLAEEMFFRGGIQRAMVKAGINYHLAVWCGAFIFSAIHFQFFGFVPRLIIGASLGYLYYYSGSLWVAAFAHAVNNSAVVLTSWMAARKLISVEIDRIGIGEDFIMALVSLIFTFIIIYFFGKKLFYYRNGKI